MLVPVLYSAAKHYPDEEFLLLTKSPLLPVFEHHPPNVRVLPAHTNGEHKGLGGLLRLIRTLTAQKIDKVADMHGVLRSRQIRFFFRLKGKRIAFIDKGRRGKRALAARYNKMKIPLKTSIERYMDVFRKLGYDFPLDFQTIFEYGERDFGLISGFTDPKVGRWIGIAPFAKHKGKQYPLEKMEKVVEILASEAETKIFLFGGKEEAGVLESLAQRHANVFSAAGHFSFAKELLLMSFLDIMLAMDSGNMHLASLVGTPVVSVWGATHPYAGFYGYRQNPVNIIQIDKLECRPCSVFGDKPCFRKDYACLHMITPEMIVERVNRVLSQHAP